MLKTDKKENPTFYAIIPAFVRYNKSLSPNAKLLYGEITTLTNKEGYCWASNKYFANVYGVDKSSITHWIKQLADEGYIRLEFIYEDGKPNITERRIFIIDLSPQKENHDNEEDGHEALEADENEGGGEKFHQGGEKTHQGVVNNFNRGGEKTPERILQANNTRVVVVDQCSQTTEKPPPETATTAPSNESVDLLKLHFAGLDQNLAFDEAFYPKILSFLAEHDLNFEYISWMYGYCSRNNLKNLNLKNLSGYLFKVLCEPRYVSLYLEASRPPPLVTITCPVCGKNFEATDLSCPECGFEKINHHDPKMIKEGKILYSMSEDSKKAYFEELDELVSGNPGLGIMDLGTKVETIKQKYGLL